MTEKELILKCSEYYDFTMDVFELTKSTIIGPYMDITLIISPYDMRPLLGRYYGGGIDIYLFSILNEYEDDIAVKQNIIISVIHELHHVIQDINFNKYETDANYKGEIEDSCDWMTWTYINRTRDILEEFLGVPAPIKSTMYGDFSNIHQRSGVNAESWTNIISAVCACSAECIHSDMKNVIENSDNCLIRFFNDGIEEPTHILLIKCKGEYYPQTEIRDVLYHITHPSTCNGGTVACGVATDEDGTNAFFTVYYSMSDGDDKSLYSPIIRNMKEKFPCIE